MPKSSMEDGYRGGGIPFPSHIEGLEERDFGAFGA